MNWKERVDGDYDQERRSIYKFWHSVINIFLLNDGTVGQRDDSVSSPS